MTFVQNETVPITLIVNSHSLGSIHIKLYCLMFTNAQYTVHCPVARARRLRDGNGVYVHCSVHPSGDCI